MSLLQVGMVVGPVAGYVPQYRSMQQQQSSAGFSLWTCGILLWANILRVFFWLGKRFEVTLLWQSLVMIAAQLVLLELCVRLRHKQHAQSPPSWTACLTDVVAGPKAVWQWRYYRSFVLSLGIYTGLLALVHLNLGDIPAYVESVGFVSLCLECTLGLPQLWANHKRQSTHGFSLVLLLSWAGGDAFKMAYFVSTNAPFQFILCGALQLTVDALLAAQFLFYPRQ